MTEKSKLKLDIFLDHHSAAFIIDFTTITESDKQNFIFTLIVFTIKIMIFKISCPINWKSITGLYMVFHKFSV